MASTPDRAVHPDALAALRACEDYLSRTLGAGFGGDHERQLLAEVRAALAAADTAPAPLDVEGLALAFHRAMNHGYHGGGWDNGDGDIAAAIATEYARQSEPS